MGYFYCTVFLILASVFTGNYCFDYDDLLSRATFPPVLEDIEGLPTGHKKPLGWQRVPEAPVKEYTMPLNANDYWKYHVKDHIPLVYRGVIKESPSIKLWDDDYLTEKYGDLDILVEHKLEDRTSTSGRMRLKDFLKNYKNSDLYVVSMFPKEMMPEVRAIPSVLCGTFKNYTHESNLWISSGGTRSVVHYDADHNLHCMIDGRKDFIMINNNLTTKTNLYFKRKDPGVGSGFSFLDPDTIDMEKFPRIAKVPWTWTTLYPGDCIYIPSMYIHQVRGYGRTLAITTLFTADVQNNFNGDDCTDEIMNTYKSMADINFQWSYKKGDPTIDMGYMNVELVKSQLVEALEDRKYTKNKKFTLKQFTLYSGSFSPYARNKTKMAEFWKNVFKLEKKDLLDMEKVNQITLEQWKAYCRLIEAAHGVVTNGSEPVFVRPGQRHQWEIEHPDEDRDDDMMTDEEKRIKEATNRDPMFDYLSDKEKEEYIKKRKEEKAKLGLKYEAEEMDLDTAGEIPWRLDDVPEKYRNQIRKGKIPKEFKDQFMEGLPDSTREKFKDTLAKNRIPKQVLNVIVDNRDSYMKKVVKQMKTDDDDDDFTNEIGDDEDEGDESPNQDDGADQGEGRDQEESEQFGISFNDLDDERRKVMINGKLIKEDINEFYGAMPQEYKDKYGKEVKAGKIPKAIMIEMLSSTEANYEKDLKKEKQKLKKNSQREEL